MEVNIYLAIIIIIIFGSYILSLVVSLLDFYYKPNNSKAKKYLKSKIKLGIVKSSFDVLVLLILIFGGLLNLLDIIIRNLGFSELLTGLLFLGAIGLIIFILDIPFSIFSIFVIEKKYNFNKTTKKTFIIDIFKSIAGYILIGAVGATVILFLFEKAGVMAWLYCWIAITLIQIFTMFIYPIFILPISNKLKILQDGELKEAIKKYLDEQNVDITLANIKIIDSSRRTNKLNAFLVGIGKNKRLVLSDTLLKNHNVPEIVAIVAHEIGHLKKKHILKKFGLYSIETFLMLYFLSFILKSNNFFMAFGVENISVYMGLILFSVIYSPIALFFSTVTNYFSRKFEFEADYFSAETTSSESMAMALDKLGSHNLTNLTPHSLKVFLEYSHPPIKDRIKRIKNEEVNDG